ncbi:MAG: S41 family peptidase [Acidobacteriota bacterium]|nr:S41 family peptidase [Acidobacteriota bacterium]
MFRPCLLVVPLLAAAFQASPAAAESSSADRNAATFDRAWTLVAETHFDPQLNGVDWDAVRDELAPRARAADSPAGLRAVLEEMLSRLGQSHFAIISSGGWSDSLDENETDLPANCSSEAYRELVAGLRTSPGGDATAGMALRLVAGEVLVNRVNEPSAAAERRVRPGWRVHSIDGVHLSEHVPCFSHFDNTTMRDQIVQSWLVRMTAGRPKSLVELQVETGAGRRKTLTLERRTPPGQIVAYGNLPPVRTHFEIDWRTTTGGRRVAVTRFNIWMLPIAGAFEHAMGELREADGIVIDLRGNPGGVAAIAQGVASHFLSERASLGTLKSRRNQLELRVFPRTVNRAGERVEPYAGPLAILIDPGSASTSEVFAAGMQDLGRATIFGEPSAGAALPAMMDELPNGDIFLHATMDYLRPSGGRVEGARIQPDHLIPTKRSDLLADRDPTLVAALIWLDTRRAPK